MMMRRWNNMVSKRRAEREKRKKIMAKATGGYFSIGSTTKEEAKLKTISFKGKDLQAFKVVKDPLLKRGWLSLFNIKR
jgi:hypothetical protein